MITSITGLICSLFYFPTSPINSSDSPTGLICGVLWTVLVFVSRNADANDRKDLSARTIAGLMLSVAAVVLAFFFFYLLLCYYEILSDPKLGPKFNEYISYLQQQLNQQTHLSGDSSWIHF